MRENKFVTIVESEYLKLKHDQAELCALEDAGVTSWEGYSDAMSRLTQED